MRRKSYLFLIKLDYINREITEIKNKTHTNKAKARKQNRKGII